MARKIPAAPEPKPEPAKLGRKAYPPELKRRARSIALTDEQWEKYKALGTEWLIERLNRAKMPV